MENDRADEILRRLDGMERRLERLEAALGYQNRAPWTAATTVVPPPRITPTTAAPRPPQPGDRPPSTPPPPSRDTEYLIGAKLLPKVGAVMVLLGVLFFVIWGFSKGWITPTMVFVGEVLFCSAFIGVGLLKRDEREEYGQILTGIGSCGMYLTFAGGHLFYHLYSGESLVALFLLLSLANLEFSRWRSSKAFFIIGLVGGLITSAILPNLKSDHSTLNAALHFLVLAPAAFIAGKNRWWGLALGLWLLADIALVPIMSLGLPVPIKVAIFYASTLVCLAAYAWSIRNEEIDLYTPTVPIALWLTALMGFAFWHSPTGSLQFLALGAALAALAFVFRKLTAVRAQLLFCAVGIPATIAAFCFPIPQAVGILATLSIVAALVSLPKRHKAAAFFAGVEFLLAAFSYITFEWQPGMWRQETLLLGLLGAAVGLSCRALARSWKQDEIFGLIALGVCVPIFSRAGVLLLGLEPVNSPQGWSVTMMLAVFAYYSMLVYRRTKWVAAFVFVWLLYGMSLFGYIFTVFTVATPVDVAYLLPMMTLPLLVTGGATAQEREGLQGLTAVIVGILFTRLFVVLSGASGLLQVAPAACVGGMLYTLGCFALLAKRRGVPMAVGGWTLFAVATVAYLAAWPMRLSMDAALASSLLVILTLGGRLSAPLFPDRRDFNTVLAGAGWLFFSRWSWVMLRWLAPAIDSSPAVTLGWVAYALCLIVLGFRYKAIEFRYVSFAVMAATVVKILLVDLATTDPALRVAVLLAIGLVMLGGGYWYVRGKAQHAAE